MEALTRRDFRALLKFLNQIYSATTPDECVAHALEGLCDLFSVDLVGYCEANPAESKSKEWFYPKGINSAETDRAWNLHMHEHPTLAHNMRTGDGQALAISDFYTQRQFRNTGLYSEAYRPMRINHVMTCAIVSHRGALAGIALHRASRSFSERNRQLLNLVRPHLFQAQHNARHFARLQQEHGALTLALENYGCGVVSIRHDDHLCFVTARARQYFADFFGQRYKNQNALPDDLRRWVTHQKKLFRAEELPSPRKQLIVASNGTRLIVQLFSHSDHDLLVMNEEKGQNLPESLHQCSGLTTREAEVLAWISRGKTNAEIATILTISSRTEQKHIEHIFQKLGVETRTAAAARVFNNVAAN